MLAVIVVALGRRDLARAPRGRLRLPAAELVLHASLAHLDDRRDQQQPRTWSCSSSWRCWSARSSTSPPGGRARPPVRPRSRRRSAPWRAASCVARPGSRRCWTGSARRSASRRPPCSGVPTQLATTPARHGRGPAPGRIGRSSPRRAADPCQRPEEAETVIPAGDTLVLALRGRMLRAEDQRLVGAFAAQAAVMLERSQLNEAVAARPHRSPRLTGCGRLCWPPSATTCARRWHPRRRR